MERAMAMDARRTFFVGIFIIKPPGRSVSSYDRSGPGDAGKTGHPGEAPNSTTNNSRMERGFTRRRSAGRQKQRWASIYYGFVDRMAGLSAIPIGMKSS